MNIEIHFTTTCSNNIHDFIISAMEKCCDPQDIPAKLDAFRYFYDSTNNKLI